MARANQSSSRIETGVANLALAQFLLLEATVESLATLGERLSMKSETEGDGEGDLLEPFRVRYSWYRHVLREQQRPPKHH